MKLPKIKINKKFIALIFFNLMAAVMLLTMNLSIDLQDDMGLHDDACILSDICY